MEHILESSPLRGTDPEDPQDTLVAETSQDQDEVYVYYDDGGEISVVDRGLQ